MQTKRLSFFVKILHIKTENSGKNTVNSTKIQNSIRKNSQQKLSQKVHKKLALTS